MLGKLQWCVTLRAHTHTPSTGTAGTYKTRVSAEGS